MDNSGEVDKDASDFRETTTASNFGEVGELDHVPAGEGVGNPPVVLVTSPSTTDIHGEDDTQRAEVDKAQESDVGEHRSDEKVAPICVEEEAQNLQNDLELENKAVGDKELIFENSEPVDEGILMDSHANGQTHENENESTLEQFSEQLCNKSEAIGDEFVVIDKKDDANGSTLASTTLQSPGKVDLTPDDGLVEHAAKSAQGHDIVEEACGGNKEAMDDAQCALLSAIGEGNTSDLREVRTDEHHPENAAQVESTLVHEPIDTNQVLDGKEYENAIDQHKEILSSTQGNSESNDVAHSSTQGDVLAHEVSTEGHNVAEPETPIERKESQDTREKGTSEVTVDQTVSSNRLVASKGKSSDEETFEWLDILGNGLLKKKVLVRGKGRETRPVNGQEVSVCVKGKLKDGTEVDCHEELIFQLGDEDAIVAMELAVSLMEDGEKAIVMTDPKYAYGKFGRPNYDPPIPEDAEIEYEIELVAIRAGKEIGSVTQEQQMAIGNNKRMKGNYLYVLGDYDGAISMYTRGIKYLEGSSDKMVQQLAYYQTRPKLSRQSLLAEVTMYRIGYRNASSMDVAELCTKIWNNLSAAQLKVQAFKAALVSCEMVLREEPENMKGHFRKGKCLEGLGDMEEALRCLKQASMLDPENKLILQELGRVKAKVVNSQKKEREMYQRMIQGSGKDQDEEGKEEPSGSWYPYMVGAVILAASSVLLGFWIARGH